MYVGKRGMEKRVDERGERRGETRRLYVLGRPRGHVRRLMIKNRGVAEGPHFFLGVKDRLIGKMFVVVKSRLIA